MNATELDALNRLVTYGTLSPGEVNHHQLADIAGRWSRGAVRGRLVNAGWGSGLGFPGIILDPAAPAVEVHVLESDQLPRHWTRLDAFEGAGYRRVATTALIGEREVPACIYALADPPPGGRP
jgi:gamma-glutamylcyclotransferase (GGCT)/AIG2-like uncharacterized protein YtfP